MNPGAVLLISLPNFKGVNGLLQKYFDPATLALHNLKIMDLVLLKEALADFGLVDIDVIYYPSTQVWVEDLSRRGLFLNILIRVLNKIMPWLGFIFGNTNKMISNSIILKARSNNA